MCVLQATENEGFSANLAESNLTTINFGEDALDTVLDDQRFRIP